jgi:glycosyltransferase involved in cell wall biosynthesis
MNSLPRITVITPSYNQGKYIEQTIKSISGQNYPNLEHLVVDGGSTDQTLDVLRKYEHQLRWVSERDRGQSDAINKGLQQATGDVICYLNSDDLFTPNALFKVGAFFQAHPQAFWLTGKCKIIDQNSKEMRRPGTLYKNFWLLGHSLNVLRVMNYISQPATFWRREAFERVGNFDERWYFAMDYDFWLRLGKYYRLWFLNEYLACFRVHPASKGSASAKSQFDEELEVAKQHVPSKTLLKLHAMHNAMSISIYNYVFHTRK